MNSSPERGSFPVRTRSAFTPADTTPAAAPRVFVAAAAGPSQPRAFDTLQLQRDPADLEAAERLREAARTAGYAEGWAYGMRAAAEQAAAERESERQAAEAAARTHEARRAAALQRAEAAVLTAAAGLRAQQDPTVGALADTVLELACDLAGAVLDRELALVDSPVLEAVQRALRPLDATRAVTIRVHPDDLHALTGEGRGGEAFKAGSGPADAGLVSFMADQTLQPGDAIARQGDTEVDARLRASVSRALEALVAADVAAAPVSPEVPGRVA